MNIIVVHDNGFSVDNDSKLIKNMFEKIINEKKFIQIKRYFNVSNLFHVIGEPKKECQVLTDNNKGYFCIFESNQKIEILKDMSDKDIQQLKNNLKEWRI